MNGRSQDGDAASSTALAPTNHSRAAARRNALLRLGLLFGTMYFIQGVSEPTEGLIVQPMRSLLRDSGRNTAQIADIMAIVALPWSIKPLFGLLIDFVPLPGAAAAGRRKPYLVLASTAGAVSLGWLYFAQHASVGPMVAALFIATMSVACADVACDALMVEKGQPLGITGNLQSIQWAALYCPTVLTGAVGGYLSQTDQQTKAFAICSVASAAALVVTLLFVRKSPPAADTAPGAEEPLSFRQTARQLARAARSRPLWAVLAFLFLWSFNPFNTGVLNDYFLRGLGLSEQFYGLTTSVLAVASMAASIAYGFYCRRVPFRLLIHGSIVLGIVATLLYLGLSGRVTAWLVTAAVGATYMTATLIQLDLAAKVCPPRVAGVVFSTLMAATNLSANLSATLGGRLYEAWTRQWGNHAAFRMLVLIGAAATVACWLVTPWLRSASSGDSGSTGDSASTGDSGSSGHGASLQNDDSQNSSL